MIEYSCAECGAPVTVDTVDGQVSIVRTCEHDGAVVANLEATVYGEAKVE